jgi:hypothetical protein
MNDIYLTAIGLTHGGSGTVHIYTQTVHTIQRYSTHLHTNSTQNTENGTYVTIKTFYCLIWEVRAVPRLCELYPDICLYTLRKKHGKTSVRVAARTAQADTVQYKNNEQYKTQKKNSNSDGTLLDFLK